VKDGGWEGGGEKVGSCRAGWTACLPAGERDAEPSGSMYAGSSTSKVARQAPNAMCTAQLAETSSKAATESRAFQAGGVGARGAYVWAPGAGGAGEGA